MKFVQFGKQYINMDHVVHIEYCKLNNPMDHVVHIEYCKPNNPYDYFGPKRYSDQQQEGYKLYTNQVIDSAINYIWIEGSDMIALEMWLKEHSDDAREPFMSEE